MKKLMIILLILGFAAPSFARRTDMMDSYGFGNKSKKYSTNKEYKKYKKSKYRYKKYRNDDYYMGSQDRYIGDRYRSEAGQMLYENEHYKNYVDRNRYLKELRKLELEQRKLDLKKTKK